MKIDRLSQTNPLRGLDLPGFVNYLERGEQGYYADLQWLYRMVLKRNAAGRAVRRKLTSALAKLDWNIKIPDKLDGERKTLAERQQKELRSRFDLLSNFSRSIVHLAMADLLGFSHLEKIYAGPLAKKLEGVNPAYARRLAGLDPWTVAQLRPVEQWKFCRQGLFAPWEFNAQAENKNTTGDRLDRRHWIIREVDDPAAEIITFAHLKMSTTDADWDQFNDTYAVPPQFAEMPPNVRKEDEERYQDLIEKNVSDGRGSHPHGAKIYTVNAGTDGVTCFTERLRFYREEIVIAGTGGILTTLDGNTGIGKGPADEHADGWMDIAAEVGKWVSETLQEEFAESILDETFPGEEHLAYFELDKPERIRGAKEVFEEAKAAREAGMEISPEELSEKSGYTVAAASSTTQPEKKPGEVTPPPEAVNPPAPVVEPEAESEKASAAGNAKPSLVAAALAEDLELEERWLSPVAGILNEIEAMLLDPAVPLAEIEKKIREAAKTAPELLGKLNVTELANALEKASGPAALEGLADGLRAKSK